MGRILVCQSLESDPLTANGSQVEPIRTSPAVVLTKSVMCITDKDGIDKTFQLSDWFLRLRPDLDADSGE